MRHPPIRIEPGDVPLACAAKRLGLSETAFKCALPELLQRGFPEADRTTGNFDLQAIDEWRRQRHPRLFPVDEGLSEAVISERIRQAFQLG